MSKKKDIRTYGIMIILGILFYLVPGTWISIEDDSIGYLAQRGREGVLPGYPVFLEFFRNILSEQYFMHAVVIVQSLLAVFCTLSFVMVLKKQFKLREAESVFLYILCMLPFSIYLPEVGITHQIMTEGVTYAIFYLFFIMIIKAVWTLQYRWYWGSMIVAVLLGLIRSQMLFLQVICCLLLLWIAIKKSQKGFRNKCRACLIALMLGLFLFFAAYKTIYAIVALDIKSQRVNSESSVEKEPENASSTRSETSQFTAIIMSRGFYEAEREDVALFDDAMMQEIFTRAYELADENKHLYQYATPGLYMWQDLVYDGMRRYAKQAIEEYDVKYPGARERDVDSIVRELGLRVLIKHFDRYLYHTVRLMIPSFIASVFFQIQPIYLLCHFVTLILYLLAIAGSIILYKKKGNKDSVELMVTTLGVIVIMVIIVNLVFMGLQRYVVYGMGIFYCAMYLLGKELLKSCLLRTD